MRFAAAHKLTTYMMVASSFAALALSGELGGLAVLGGLIAIAVSWFWEPPRIRIERFTPAWTILSAVVLAYSLLMVLGSGDILIIGAEFILYLLVAKLFNRRTNKDYQQVYVLTFLMLVAGTVLNSEFTYGLFFLFYVIAATWALILFHLRREMEDNFLLKHSGSSSRRVQVERILNSRRIVGGKFFLGTSAVSLSIFLVATLLFLMIPRIGFGLFFQKDRSGLTMTGFSDGVRLGGHGVIKNDDTVVMRVEIDDEYRGRRAPHIHWRGVAFDQYAGGQWSRSAAAPATEGFATLSPSGDRERHHLLYARESLSARARDRRIEEAVEQEIYLEPIGYDVLFGASMPLAYEFDPAVGTRRPRRASNDEIRYPHTAGIKYTVYSQLSKPPAAELRAAPDELPEGYGVYLQIPDEVSERVRTLAREITEGAETDYDKAVAIEQWLQNELSYTLQMKSPGDTEPIEHFLFERRRGHCEYFSSAMAIMARSVGVPTRNVNGFLGGEWNEFDDFIAVRAGDAHSWVEVYFDGVGWVTFDPTPSGTVDVLGRGDSGLRDQLRRFVDSLRFKWFQWVIEYDLYRQLSLFKKFSNTLRGGASELKLELEGGRELLEEHKITTAAALLGAIFAITVVALVRHRRRENGAPDGKRRRPRRRGPIGEVYARTLRRLDRRGYKRKSSLTPREHAARLDEAGAPGADALAELTEIYYAAEYGDGDADALAPRARELAAEIDEALRERRRAAG